MRLLQGFQPNIKPNTSISQVIYPEGRVGLDALTNGLRPLTLRGLPLARRAHV